MDLSTGCVTTMDIWKKNGNAAALSCQLPRQKRLANILKDVSGYEITDFTCRSCH